MKDALDFGIEVLPGLLGIATAFYAAALIRRRLADFLRFIRSWTVILLIASLAAQWFVELLMYSNFGVSEQLHEKVDITLIVMTSWLAICAILLSTSHTRYNDPKRFVTWMRRRPLNVFTIWGTVGVVIVGLSWASKLRGESIFVEDLPLLALVLGYLLISLGAVVSLPAAFASKERMAGVMPASRMSVILFTFALAGTPSAEFVFDLILRDGLGWSELNPHNWILLILLAAMMRAVFVGQFLAITVDSETEITRRDGFRSFDIPRGVYLVYDEKPDSVFKLFSELVTLPLRPDAKIPETEESASATLEFLIPKGLVVTREYPDSIRSKHNLHVTPIIWLTESPGENRIAPTSLTVLTDTVVRFMEENPNSIVLMDGVEYIMTFNDFKKVLRSLDTLNETAWITKARLLIALNPRAFDERNLALLERDRKVLKGSLDIEELKRESRVEALASSL